MSEFTCYKCKITYQKRNDEEWNEFKAAEEMLALYPETKNHPTYILCDDCNEEFKVWFSTLTDEQKKKMRDDFDNRCQTCDGHGEYYLKIEFLDDLILVGCEDCKKR